MTREELIEKMHDAFNYAAPTMLPSMNQRMAAALDVAVGELLEDPSDAELSNVEHSWIFGELPPGIMYRPSDVAQKVRDAACIFNSHRRSRYLKPKSDPAVEAVKEISLKNGWCSASQSAAEQIVAAVRNADKGTAQ